MRIKGLSKSINKQGKNKMETLTKDEIAEVKAGLTFLLVEESTSADLKESFKKGNQVNDIIGLLPFDDQQIIFNIIKSLLTPTRIDVHIPSYRAGRFWIEVQRYDNQHKQVYLCCTPHYPHLVERYKRGLLKTDDDISPIVASIIDEIYKDIAPMTEEEKLEFFEMTGIRV
jgi:hypothetical protein